MPSAGAGLAGKAEEEGGVGVGLTASLGLSAGLSRGSLGLTASFDESVPLGLSPSLPRWAGAGLRRSPAGAVGAERGGWLSRSERGPVGA